MLASIAVHVVSADGHVVSSQDWPQVGGRRPCTALVRPPSAVAPCRAACTRRLRGRRGRPWGLQPEDHAPHTHGAQTPRRAAADRCGGAYRFQLIADRDPAVSARGFLHQAEDRGNGMWKPADEQVCRSPPCRATRLRVATAWSLDVVDVELPLRPLQRDDIVAARGPAQINRRLPLAFDVIRHVGRASARPRRPRRMPGPPPRHPA